MGLIQQLGYIAFEVSNTDAWDSLTTGVMGLSKVNPNDTGFDLQMDDYRQRMFVRRGPADDVTALGLEVADAAALNQVAETLIAEGIAVERGSPADAASRGVEALIRCKDPSDVPLEIYHGMAKAEAPFSSEQVPAGFIAGDQGFGHVVVTSNDAEATRRFYMDLLGFQLSDHIHIKFGEMEFLITFTHVNKRHHSIAFAAAWPKKIHHFMVQAKTIDDVGAAFDRANDLGLGITQALGRHTNDKMFSFYGKTPSGFEYEFGADAVEIGDDWQPARYDRGSSWGHHRPK